MMTSRASAAQMTGELREGKRRLFCGKVRSKVEGWVMALRASGTSPRNALCHDTGFGSAESDAGFGSALL